MLIHEYSTPTSLEPAINENNTKFNFHNNFIKYSLEPSHWSVVSEPGRHGTNELKTSSEWMMEGGDSRLVRMIELQWTKPTTPHIVMASKWSMNHSYSNFSKQRAAAATPSFYWVNMTLYVTVWDLLTCYRVSWSMGDLDFVSQLENLLYCRSL